MLSPVQFGQRFYVATPGNRRVGHPDQYAPTTQLRDIANAYELSMATVVLTSPKRKAELNAAGLHLRNSGIFTYDAPTGDFIDKADIILTEKDAKEFLGHYYALRKFPDAVKQYIAATASQVQSAPDTIRLELKA